MYALNFHAEPIKSKNIMCMLSVKEDKCVEIIFKKYFFPEFFTKPS